jgi:hypothetical protein
MSGDIDITALGPRRLASIQISADGAVISVARTHRLTKLVFRVAPPVPGESIYRLIARVAAAAAEADET